MSAAAWADFGQALGAGALKNLKTMVFYGLNFSMIHESIIVLCRF
jgi:Na+-driven multidrug efflux pump